MYTTIKEEEEMKDKDEEWVHELKHPFGYNWHSTGNWQMEIRQLWQIRGDGCSSTYWKNSTSLSVNEQKIEYYLNKADDPKKHYLTSCDARSTAVSMSKWYLCLQDWQGRSLQFRPWVLRLKEFFLALDWSSWKVDCYSTQTAQKNWSSASKITAVLWA